MHRPSESKQSLKLKRIKIKVALPKVSQDNKCGDTNLVNLLQGFYSDFTKNKKLFFVESCL